MMYAPSHAVTSAVRLKLSSLNTNTIDLPHSDTIPTSVIVLPFLCILAHSTASQEEAEAQEPRGDCRQDARLWTRSERRMQIAENRSLTLGNIENH
jgi:hypothetical protein